MPVQPPQGFRGRHALEAPPPPTMGFICPACGAQNAGPIADGCTHCGAGTQKATHVEAPPEGEAEFPKWTPKAETVDVDAAFLAWIKPFRGKWDAAGEAIAYLAFKAGYEMHQTQTATAPLPGTAESRTILAALRFFLSEVLPQAQEEIASGELLSIRDTEALIRRLEQAH